MDMLNKLMGGYKPNPTMRKELLSAPSLNDFSLGCGAAVLAEESRVHETVTKIAVQPPRKELFKSLSLPVPAALETGLSPKDAQTPTSTKMMHHGASLPHAWQLDGMDMYEYKDLACDLSRSP